MRPEFFIYLAKRKLPNCVSTSRQSFIFGRKNREYAPRTFSAKLAGNELQKCARTPRQTASFSDANLVIMCPELLYKPRKVKISEMRLNFAGNNFIFGHINRENAPITFSVNLAGREF